MLKKKINNRENKAEWENCEKFTTYFSREHLTAHKDSNSSFKFAPSVLFGVFTYSLNDDDEEAKKKHRTVSTDGIVSRMLRRHFVHKTAFPFAPMGQLVCKQYNFFLFSLSHANNIGQSLFLK